MGSIIMDLAAFLAKELARVAKKSLNGKSLTQEAFLSSPPLRNPWVGSATAVYGLRFGVASEFAEHRCQCLHCIKSRH